MQFFTKLDSFSNLAKNEVLLKVEFFQKSDFNSLNLTTFEFSNQNNMQFYTKIDISACQLWSKMTFFKCGILLKVKFFRLN